MTVWIYVDTTCDIGDADHLKVFASEAATEAWFKENDAEGRGLRIRGDRQQRLKPHRRRPITPRLEWQSVNRVVAPAMKRGKPVDYSSRHIAGR